MTKAEVLELVKEGAKLDAKLRPFAKDVKRLEEIKALLRTEADGSDAAWDDGRGHVATVKFTKDGICRSVAADLVPGVKALAGRKLHVLFSLAPVKEFELAALKALPKDPATELVKLLRVPGQGRVTFGS